MSTETFAIVTGASSGLGRAICESLIEREYIVFGGSRSGSDLEHENYIDLDLDVTNEESVLNFFEGLREHTECADILVNAAGLGAISETVELESEVFIQDLMTKPYGLFLTLKHFQDFIIKDETHIINILSQTSLDGFENTASLSASEHGAYGLIKAIEKEWSDYGARFSNLFCGAVDTPFWDNVDLKVDRSSMLSIDEFMFIFDTIIEAPSSIIFPKVEFKHKEGFQ
jgi:3-oxoacyl-[acyl-carrier protein] reductase